MLDERRFPVRQAVEFICRNDDRSPLCLATSQFDGPSVIADLAWTVNSCIGSGKWQCIDINLDVMIPTSLPVVAAYQALRGVSFIVAVTFVSEVGDVRRFDNPRQLMAFLGLVPSERSTGETVKRGGLTLAGNRRARRVLVEGAWSYRYPARVSEPIRVRLEGLPKAVGRSPGRRRPGFAPATAA